MTDSGKVLVTGAGGFIGSHLVEALLARGEQVRALVRYASHGGAGWLEEVPDALRGRLEVVRGDVRDARTVTEVARGCREIHHLAALIGIPYSYAAPDAYVDVNVRGTLNVLEAARALAIPRTVVVSTSEVYGTALRVPIDEDHPLQPQSPYSATKIGAESLALSYHRSFELPVTVVRPFNTYGPRQSARAVIPTILSQVLGEGPLRIGSLDPVRDFVYVEDTAAGLIAAARSDACVGQVVNLATGAAVSVGQLVELAQALAGRRVVVEELDERRRPAASEVLRLIGDAGRAARLAGWSAQVPLERGLQRTLAWIRTHLDRFRIGVYER